MESPGASFTLLGEEPKVKGRVLKRLILQQAYANGGIIDDANVAFLRFGRDWFHLCFECAMVFWRQSQAPIPPENDALSRGLILNDLSAMTQVVGQVLESIDYDSTSTGDVQVKMRFRNGRYLRFSYACATDSTRVTVD